MTVTTDHHHRRRLPFVGMLRSRSSSSKSGSNSGSSGIIMVKRHRLQDDNFCATDDDSSTSSTMSAGRNTSSAALLVLPLLSESVPPPVVTPDTPATEATTHTLAATHVAVNKEVRFNEEHNQVHENNSPQMRFKDECKELWYGPSDYVHFKKSVIYLSREIALAEQRNTAPYSYQRVMMRTYKACCQSNTEATETETSGCGVLSDQEEKHLIRWMDVSTSRLGVEKLALRAMARDRSHRRNEMKELVFEIQEITTTTTSSDHGDEADADDDTRAEFIRNTCLAISRPSRLFAMHLAVALAASIHH